MTIVAALLFAAFLVESMTVASHATRALLPAELTPAQIRAKAKRDAIRAMRQSD